MSQGDDERVVDRSGCVDGVRRLGNQDALALEEKSRAVRVTACCRETCDTRVSPSRMQAERHECTKLWNERSRMTVVEHKTY